MTSSNKRISILGAGMWGRTIGLLLSRNEIDISLWDIRDNLAVELPDFYSGMKSNGHEIISEPVFTNELSDSLQNAELVFFVLPTSAVRPVAKEIKNLLPQECPIIVATKGIEESGDDFHLMSSVIEDVLGNNHPVGILSGPNLSLEIQARHPAVSLIASANDSLVELAMSLLASDIFRVYGSRDVIGVQIGGAVKNVIALAAGMVDELGFEHNTKAALLTRGLVEIIRMGEKMGGESKTFTGISGLGDLICTASSPTSRNYRAGRMFGKGMKREEIEIQIGQVIEGIENARTVNRMSDKLDVVMPISKGVYNIVWEDRNPMDAIKELMTRDLKFE